ncbi:hypothetical protein BU25DRAFT_219956 [Macroventuria anomochaeta]|uniref:Uncharacterized protein n=1 Tax=Macroventuria anomochaeta TaxID=301207 RepID=A0ACB6RJA1_9PLEO|nr:uncharacterized protein BU25DRAFT_219956 [Macroventuria anomochaeta]KAF2621990.1 hypothetical protein BU25DRAFT_219956 [Macroventuria anomochaeta]
MSKKRLRHRFNTPPRELVLLEEDKPAQLHTPQRSAIISSLYFCEQTGYPASREDIHKVFGYAERTVTNIIATGRCCRLENADLPDTRGGPRLMTNSDANAIASYLDNCPFEEKGLPWQDLADKAGVAKRRVYSLSRL